MCALHMRKLIIGIALLTAGGLALVAWEPPASSSHGPTESAPRVELSGARIPATNSGTPRALPVRAPAATARSVAERKYRYLLGDLDLSAEQREQILALLIERDALAPRPSLDGDPVPPDPERDHQLAVLEDELRAELPAGTYASYEMYRDSEVEQYQVDEYTGGLREYAPLDAAQERAVLDAKLRQKRQFSRIIEESGIERPSLSLEEREHAMSLLEQGLKDYRESYLAEIAPVLNERQFNQLSSFEATEFQGELERLQRIVNTR